MKKEAAVFLLAILLVPFISASISDIFSYIDSQTIFILVAFGVFSLLIKAILDRFPKFHGTTAGIMSLLLSLGMTWGINKWINVNDFFISLGFSGDFVPYLVIALFIILIISLFIFDWKGPLALGLIFIIISLFTNLVYEKTIVIIAGAVLIAISLIWIFVLWRKNKPKNMSFSNIKNPQAIINGMPRLILEAKAYRQIADKQVAPKMYKTLENFINYLKQRGYGRNEIEICQRMNIRQKDIQKVFRKDVL
jgi:hypothetical protein